MPAELAERTNLWPEVRYFGSAAFHPHTDGSFVLTIRGPAQLLPVITAGILLAMQSNLVISLGMALPA